MALSVHILGSGSSGNSALISTSRTRLLFDLGFSKKETLNRLGQVGCGADSVDALFISHEHADHVGGLKHFRKEFKIPVFMTEGTREACARAGEEAERSEPIFAGRPVQFREFTIVPLAVSHDAAQPVAFVVAAEGVRIALVIDLGEVSPLISRQIRGVDCLVLESNHDVEMLRVGPYPWSLKQRVMGPQGHLSNAAAADFLRDGYDGCAEYIVLAHISQVNNHPEIARLTAEEALRARSQRSLFGSRLRMAPQDRPAEPMVF